MKKIIYLDEKTDIVYPFEQGDYNSRLILNFLYDPIFYKENGEYKSDIVNLNQDGKFVFLKFKENLWSNSENLLATHMYQTLKYILSKKMFISGYLDFIEGVDLYLYEREKYKDNQVKIYVEENTLIFKTLDVQIDYVKDILSSIHCSPVYFKDDKPIKTVSNGAYIIENESEFLLKKNPSFSRRELVSPKEIVFEVEKNSKEQIINFKKKNCLMTSTTIFNNSEISDLEKYNNDDLYQQISNIFFRIEIKKSLKSYKSNLKKYLEKSILDEELLKSIELADSYLETLEFSDQIESNDKVVHILCSDYYPNPQIAKLIEKYFKTLGFSIRLIKCDLEKFSETYERGEYDICLNLVNPVINNELNNLISWIPFFEDTYVDKYIDMLNEKINNPTLKLQKSIDSYLDKNCLGFNLGKFKLNYLKSKELLNLKKDFNDDFKFIK